MLPDRIRSLSYLLTRLPGVGEKTAQRFALHLVSDGLDLANDLGAALCDLQAHIGLCEKCGNIAERQAEAAANAPALLCSICLDDDRDRSTLCVVARVQDLLALERSGAVQGLYFVLGALLSPLEGIGPEQLPLDHLRRRLSEDAISEVILATPPSVDGEATALFLGQELESASVAVTRIASGIPHGGDLEFADQITLGRAIRGRRGMAGKP